MGKRRIIEADLRPSTFDLNNIFVIGKDINKAATLLEAGELVAIPTETVYGLAANALNETAVVKIFEAKNRPFFDPLIVHLAQIEQIPHYTQNIPEKAHLLARHFMPGPLTLLLEKTERISDLVTAGSPLVAIRIPRHLLSRELLGRLSFPLAAPSANPFGYISPTTAQHVEQQLGDIIPYILDGGPCEVGLESTIVGFQKEQVVVFRKGGIPVEAIEQIVGKVIVQTHSSSNPNSPGRLESHYAPATPIILGDIPELVRVYAGKKIGIISFQEPFPNLQVAAKVILSEQGDFSEAARNLFSGMRRLDEQSLDVIIAGWAPEEHLGRAINDRLSRAAAKRSH
jgi:L-threonylcarbamoyladenylate synthase